MISPDEYMSKIPSPDEYMAISMPTPDEYMGSVEKPQQDPRLYGIPEGASPPISTITGKPVFESEETLPKYQTPGYTGTWGKEYNIPGGIKDIGKFAYDIPVNTMGAMASMWEDDNPESEYDWKDIARKAQTVRNEQRATEAGGEEYVLPWVQRKDIREASASAGFSGVAMGAGALGGVAASPIPVPGARVGGALAGSGIAAYKMDKAMFTQQLIDAYRQTVLEDENRDVTPDEVASLVEKTKDLRGKHALWEAIPEAVGNVAQLSGIGAIFKATLGKNLGIRVFKTLVGMYGAELGTETITQTGQHNVEIEAGLSAGQSRSFTSMDDMYESFKEVAPQTFVLVSLTGGGGAVAGKTYQLIANPKNNIDASEVSPIVQKFNKGEIELSQVVEQINASNASGEIKESATNLLKEGKALTTEEVTTERARIIEEAPRKPAEISAEAVEITGKEKLLAKAQEAKEKSVKPRILTEGVYGSKRGLPFENEGTAKLNQGRIAKEMGIPSEDLTMVQVEDGFAWQKTEMPIPTEPTAEIARELVGVEIPEFKSTGEAVAFGEKATPEQITELKRLRQESLDKYEVLEKQDKLNEAIIEATKGQLYRESFEAAEKPVKEVAAEKVEKPWEMTVEEFKANPPKGYYLKKLAKDDIAQAMPDGRIALDPENYFGQPKEIMQEIIEHEQAHFVEEKISPEFKAKLFDNKEVMAYRGRNINEKLTNMIQDGKLSAEVLAEYPELKPTKPLPPKPPKAKPPEAVTEEIKGEVIPEVKPKKPTPSKPEKFYVPGNIIWDSYWKAYDKVLDFKINEFGDWETKVQRVDKEGNPIDKPRWHSTSPDKTDRIVSEVSKPTKEVIPEVKPKVEKEKVEVAPEEPTKETYEDYKTKITKDLFGKKLSQKQLKEYAEKEGLTSFGWVQSVYEKLTPKIAKDLKKEIADLEKRKSKIKRDVTSRAQATTREANLGKIQIIIDAKQEALREIEASEKLEKSTGVKAPEGKVFATKAIKPQDTITRADLKSIFAKMKNISAGQDKAGSFWFKVMGRPKVTIYKVNYIPGYIDTSSGRIAVGSFLGNTIELKTGGEGHTADIGTAWHEFAHYLEKNGILSGNDIKALNGVIAKSEGISENKVTEENRATYVGDRLSEWQGQKNLRIKRVLKKIVDFVNAIYEFVSRTRTARGVLADIETGKILSEKELSAVNQFAQDVSFSLKKAVKVITDNPNFVKWFGNSEIVTKDGSPLIMYHGTYSDVTIFDRDRINLGPGFFFTKSKQYASKYATRYGKGGNIISVYLSLKNPLKMYIKKDAAISEDINRVAIDKKSSWVEEAKRRGYDGVYYFDTPNRGGEVAVFESTQIKSIYNTGAFGITEPDIMFQMAGEKAIGAPTGRLVKAQEMLAEGKDKKEVWRETGWMKGAEKEKTWKFEIDDSGAKIKETERDPAFIKINSKEIKTLNDLIEHKELFEAYPELRNVKIRNDFIGEAKASYDIEANSIVFPRGFTTKGNELKDILLHEIQHAIQEIEGFAKGGTPETFERDRFRTLDWLTKAITGYSEQLKKYSKEDKKYTWAVEGKAEAVDMYQKVEKTDTYEQYRRLAGEIEAREVEIRKNLTAEQRRIMPPYADEAIPEDQWIITKGAGTSFSVEESKMFATKPTFGVDYIKVLDRYEAKLKAAETKLEKIKTSKEILKRRRGFIRAVADYFNLTDRELRQISGKDIRFMSNFEFKQYIDGIRLKSEEFDVKRQASNELDLIRKEKEFINEDNIRNFHKLPTIKRMTKKQLNEYAGILNKYEEGDQFLTPKRIKGIEDTQWKGSKTVREVLEKASKELDTPLLQLMGIRVKELDRFRYDTSLARQHPYYNFAVDTIKIEEIKSMFKYFKAREKLYRLGKLALKSRKRGIIGRLIPRQKELMKYLEAEGDAKIEAAKGLTSEEMALGEYIWEFYEKAYNWLLIAQELKSSRFADSKYVFHSKRPLSELLIDLKDTGIKSAAKDLLNRWRLDEAQFKILDSKTGKILRLKKFFRQTLYRTGELIPTKNVIKATDIYMQQFFRKMALDNSVPAIETLAMALRPKEKTKTGIFLNDSLMTFVKEYLNNKKGRTVKIGIQQGGRIDTIIRLVNHIVSLRYIALNIPLEVAAIVGETTAKMPALGNRKLILANVRKFTPRGRRILKKYKAYTGEGVLEEVFQPARNIGENINMLLYGLFKWGRKVTKQDILLGNMTKAEFESEAISPEKLAEITKIAGRWLDIEGSKSVMGSTSTGGTITKFKGWAIPIASSASHDAMSLARTITRLGDPKKRLTKQQFQELYRIAEMGAIVGAVLSLGVDDEKDTFAGRLKYYAIRELGTIFNALRVLTVLSGGVTVAFLEKLSQNLYLLATLEKYKTKDELKGARALKKQFTPAAISQFTGGKEKKPLKGGKTILKRFDKKTTRFSKKKPLSDRWK